MTLVEHAPSSRLVDLAHPQPDLSRPGEDFRRHYSSARREAYVRSVMTSAISGVRELLRRDFAFLLPYSPFRDGDAALHAIVEDASGSITVWWQPSEGGSPVNISTRERELVPSLDDIERAISEAAARAGRPQFESTISDGRIIEWVPNTAPGSQFASKLLDSWIDRALRLAE